jgi:hypothetical protein
VQDGLHHTSQENSRNIRHFSGMPCSGLPGDLLHSNTRNANRIACFSKLAF